MRRHDASTQKRDDVDWRQWNAYKRVNESMTEEEWHFNGF